MAWKRQVALLALTMAASIALADAAKGKKKGGKGKEGKQKETTEEMGARRAAILASME